MWSMSERHPWWTLSLAKGNHAGQDRNFGAAYGHGSDDAEGQKDQS